MYEKKKGQLLYEGIKLFKIVKISKCTADRIQRGKRIYICLHFNKNIEEREYRFRVDIKNPEKKIVQNPRLYHLLNHFELNDKAFIYNEKNKMYIPTDISIAE